MDILQKNKYVTNFTTDDMISKFEAFTNHKLNPFYLTDSMRTEWLQILDEYWDEERTHFSSSFGLLIY